MGLGAAIGGAIGGIASGVAGLIGGAQSNASAERLNQLNYEHQKEFAQNGIRWRVADAKAAGLHPLAALGFSGASYSPSAVVGDSPDYSFLADAGQNIGRAMDAKKTEQERLEQQAKQDTVFKLEMEGRKLDNENKRLQNQAITQDMAMQLARSVEMASRTRQQVPGLPSLAGDDRVIAGQRESYPTGATELETSKVPSSLRGDPSTQAGVPPDSRTYSSRAGGVRVVYPTESTADTLDAVWPVGPAQWYWRNHILPYLGNFTDAIEDKRRRPGEYFDLFSGGYRKGRRIRDYFK